MAPDFATSHAFYVYLTNLDGDIEIRRYQTMAGDPFEADLSTAQTILYLDDPNPGVHISGWIDFGPDGYLYATIGDGDISTNPQDTNSLFGKLLRIDVSADALPRGSESELQHPGRQPLRDQRRGA
jgi:glucose/arabinose dehydrogenase